MTVIGFFYIYIFLWLILPLYIIFLIGKPIFLIKLLQKLLEVKIPYKDIKALDILIISCILFDIYFILNMYSVNNKLKLMLSSSGIDPRLFQNLLSQSNVYERNTYIFLTSIAMLFSVQKFAERHLRNQVLSEELGRLMGPGKEPGRKKVE